MKRIACLLLMTLSLGCRLGLAKADFDVYLLVGQSNMAGRGPLTAADTADVIAGVYLLNAEGKPEPAMAPLNRYSSIRKDLKLQEVGPGVSFGQKMHRLTGRQILLVQNARGGSSIRSWQPEARAGYLDSAIVRTKQALRYGTLRGICWHQGETDVPQAGAGGEALDAQWEPGSTPASTDTKTLPPQRYVELFRTMAEALRRELGDVPIVVGEVGQWGWANARDIALFNGTTLPQVCQTVSQTARVSSHGLGRRWADKPRDPHFSREAALELGDRYAEAMMRLLPAAACPVRVAQYPDGRQAAISFTYDDGLAEHFSLVAPELERRGFRATFWVIGSQIGGHSKGVPTMSWAECRQLSDRGHEVSSHSWSHLHMPRLSRDTLLQEILKNDSAIEAATGRRPVTFCFPFNERNDLALRLASNGRVGVRTHQVAHGEERSKQTPERLSSWLRQTIDQHAWGVTMTHGITIGYDRWLHPEWLWAFYDEVKAKEDSVWVAPFAEVSAYVAEREAARLRVHDGYRHKIIIHPSLALDERLFTQPLTLEVMGQWSGKSVRARQGSAVLDVDNRGDRLLIRYNPAGRRIKITWK